VAYDGAGGFLFPFFYCPFYLDSEKQNLSVFHLKVVKISVSMTNILLVGKNINNLFTKIEDLTWDTQKLGGRI
jgi:hypothetical protein